MAGSPRGPLQSSWIAWLLPRTLFVLRDGRALPLFLLAQLGRELGTKVLGLEKLPDLDFTFLERNALRPLQGLGLVLHLPDPKAGDQLLGLRERAVPHGALVARVRDPRPLRRRRQTLAREHDARLDQLVVEFSHLGELLLGRHGAGLILLVAFYDHEESHG